MQSREVDNPRGAMWNRWDPHIHAPGTILSDQYRESDPWEQFLSQIEKSDPSIRTLGITDYYSITIYEEVVKKKRNGRLANVDLIFPNVEMRFGIETGKGAGINFHILFSPEDPDHIARVERFLGELHFRFKGESYCCEASDLVRLGKAYDQSVGDARRALEIGANQFKVNFDELRTAWRESEWVQQNALVAVAGGRGDGTSALSEDASFTALRREIEAFAHIIFSASPQQREFWLGKGVASKEELLEKWGGCKPCLHGSDAHKTEKVGKPDLDRFCWIKGDLTFESLRQACLEPEGRTLVHSEPPSGALPSQTMETVEVSNAPWFTSNVVPLNPGLVAIIGARGSGKTALADLIAAGAYALSAHLNASSFVHRAADHLADSTTSLVWQSGEKTETPLIGVSTDELFESPRVQYLSQQFVEQLCSAEGVEDELLTEIERVMFHSHSIEDRLGASAFRELLDIRLARARSHRERQEESLRFASESLTAERTRKASLAGLTKHREEKCKFIEKDKKDRKALTAKGTRERVQRLEEISVAVDAARRMVEDARAKHRGLLLLQDAVASLRKTSGPAYLKELRKNYVDAGLSEAQWKSFELTFAGDVDSILKAELIVADKLAKSLSGPADGEIQPDIKAQPSVTPYIQPTAILAKQTLSLLEKELTRLRRLVGIDADNAKKLTTLSEKIAKDESALGKLDKEIELARGAEARIKDLIEDRKNAYAGVFEAIIEEQRQLSDLYGPLKLNLSSQGGELSKLSFSVRRSVDVETWAKVGEGLLDLRELGPFKGKGRLQEIAQAELVPAWERGTSAQVAEAMTKFRDKHEQSLVEHAPVKRTDRNAYAVWARSISDWLYSTSHVTVSYSLQYDGVEIEQLSPGTRGIVLLLLFVAVDTDDDRPLIIDQPEENLDPKSIYDDLVDRFKTARLRRQIIIITHNANLVVNTDADQVIVAECGPHRPGYLPEISYTSGGLENPAIRTKVCEILEGGETAFRERAKRLRVRM